MRSSAHVHSSLEPFISWIIGRVYFASSNIYLCPPCLIPVFVLFVVSCYQIRRSKTTNTVLCKTKVEIRSNYGG